MNPYFSDDQVTLYAGDCVEVLKTLPENSIDSVVCDPPYGLEFMGKDWDAPWKQADALTTARMNRDELGDVVTEPAAEGGFQDGAGGNPYSRSRIRYGRGKTAASHVDARARRADEVDDPVKGKYIRANVNAYEAGRPFQAWCETWARECLRVLKPGGHILAFGGSRTWHRLAAAIEDAGFEIRDSIAWLYGSGFPKSRDVTEAMNSYLAGEVAESPIRPGLYDVTSFLRDARDNAGWSNKQIDELFGTHGMAGHWTSQASQPACPSVRQWEVLKAKLGFGDEMDDLVAELASTERPEDWGSGASEDSRFLDTLRKNGDFQPAGDWGSALKPAFEPIVVGRKPIRASLTANVLQHGTGALHIGACRVPSDDGFEKAWDKPVSSNTANPVVGGLSGSRERKMVDLSDKKPTGGRWPTNVIFDEHQAAELDKQSGVTTSRRAELTSTPGGIYGGGKGLPSHTGVYGYNDAGGASRYFPTFKYTPKAATSERPSADGVSHPTVKPVSLLRWLIRLVTPPHGTVLDPFGGSGTTGEAAIHEHMHAILIEREPTYLPLIVARLSKPMAVGFDFDQEEPA